MMLSSVMQHEDQQIFPQSQPESISFTRQGLSQANVTKYTPGTGDDGSEEMWNRVDVLMTELTRLMDGLENTNALQQTNANNNSTTLQHMF